MSGNRVSLFLEFYVVVGVVHRVGRADAVKRVIRELALHQRIGDAICAVGCLHRGAAPSLHRGVVAEQESSFGIGVHVYVAGGELI